MPLHVENHPFSALSRQIEHLLWTSVVLIFFAVSASLLNRGRLSLLALPFLSLLTLVHNLTLIALVSRDRRRTTAALKGTLAPTAARAAVIVSWGLAALWAAVAVLVAVISGMLMAHGMLDRFGRLAAWGELPLLVVEAGVMAVLAAKSGKQRRATVQRPESVDWRHMRPPVSARV